MSDARPDPRTGPIDALVLRQLARANTEICTALGLTRPEEVMLALMGAAGVVLGQADPLPADRLIHVEDTANAYYHRGQAIGACARLGRPVIIPVRGEIPA